MKPKNIFSVFVLSISTFIYAQNNNTNDPLQIQTFKLDNGLTVYLNQDNNMPDVFGGIIVKSGSKRDPEGHPGVAHYFEHIMFKGTDKIGTIDYEKEKVFLDSISLMYDSLAMFKDAQNRERIQKKINNLSVKAADYAIPTEMDKILEEMGCTGVNAWTSYDEIVFHNNFPPEKIEKWLELYSERFMHPVYRLFQSELETVYEEKNMSMESPFEVLLEKFQKKFYKNHPYGNSILGEIDNLKNPSLSKMDEYYKTYFVTNNMALFLCGNFNPAEIIPLIKEKFSRLRSSTVPQIPEYKEEDFKGRKFISERLTPIKIGILGFKSVPKGHKDQIKLDIVNLILSNNSSTGLLDKLSTENKIMGAFIFSDNLVEKGSIDIMIIPKIIGQSLKKAEGLVMAEIEKVKKGEFDEELLDAVKTEEIVNFQKQLENSYARCFLMLDGFLVNKSWNEILDYSNQVKKITKQDIIDIANKYYGENYLAFYSKTGFPKKQKIDKPPYENLNPKNQEAKSEYAKNFENIKDKEIIPRFIEFNPDKTKEKLDVICSDINDKVHFYYTENPYKNDNLFSLEIKYGAGAYKYPLIEYTANYLDLIGTENNKVDEYKRKLQKIGSSIYYYCDDSYFTISVDGLDEHFQETIILLKEMLEKAKPEQEKIENLWDNAKGERKYETKEPEFVGYVLEEYALYKEKSDYVDRLSLKEIKNLSGDSLVSLLNVIKKYEADIHYSGKLPADNVKKTLTDNLSLNNINIRSESPIEKKREEYKQNTVFYLNYKKAIQSKDYFIVEGETSNNEDEIAFAKAFNEYLDGGCFAIVFQETRENKSLTYGAYAGYNLSFYKDKKGYLDAYIGTQDDKTIESMQTMNNIITKLPEKSDRIEKVRASLLLSINSQRPLFRNLSPWVEYWKKQGYNDDPRKYRVDVYKKMTFDDIMSFYKKNISGKPVVYTVVGDKSRLDMNELAKFGKIIEVKEEDIFRK